MSDENFFFFCIFIFSHNSLEDDFLHPRIIYLHEHACSYAHLFGILGVMIHSLVLKMPKRFLTYHLFDIYYFYFQP